MKFLFLVPQLCSGSPSRGFSLLSLFSHSYPDLRLTLQPRSHKLGLTPASRVLGLQRPVQCQHLPGQTGMFLLSTASWGSWPGSTLQRGCWPCPGRGPTPTGLGGGAVWEPWEPWELLSAPLGPTERRPAWSRQHGDGLISRQTGVGFLASLSITYTPRHSTCIPHC